MVRLHGYLIAIGLLCVAVAFGVFVAPEEHQTARRLRVGYAFIAAAAAFLLLQLVTLMLAYGVS